MKKNDYDFAAFMIVLFGFICLIELGMFGEGEEHKISVKLEKEETPPPEVENEETTPSGVLTNFFGPSDPITRAQMARMLVKGQTPVDRFEPPDEPECEPAHVGEGGIIWLNQSHTKPKEGFFDNILIPNLSDFNKYRISKGKKPIILPTHYRENIDETAEIVEPILDEFESFMKDKQTKPK